MRKLIRKSSQKYSLGAVIALDSLVWDPSNQKANYHITFLLNFALITSLLLRFHVGLNTQHF